MHPQAWLQWRPEYKTNASFVATLKGTTSTGQNITRFTNVRFTFDLGTPSKWKGVCMNFNGDTDENVKETYENVKETYENVKETYENVKETYENVKETYENVKETYENVKETYENVKETYENVKETYENVKETYENVKETYDLFFRKEDNASGSGYTYTVKRPIEVPGEENNVSGQPVEIGLEITETEGGNSSVTVTVRVNDYAAVGILSASATFNYEDPSSGSTSWEGNATNEISIPLDNNGNDIADGWNPVSHSLDLLLSSADMNVNYDPWADGETGPGTNMYTGDGFTVFEEYRGFYVKGSHTSINPSRKDVFISSQNVEGIGHASGLPYPIVTHEINFNEANMLPDPDGIPFAPDQIPDPWINFNSCGDLLTVVQQNALWIKNMGIDRDGSTLLGVTASAGPVHEVDYIWIFVNTIDRLVDSPY